MRPSESKVTTNKNAIFLAATSFQAYQLFLTNKVVLPKGFTLRSIIRVFADVENPKEEIFGFIAESKQAIVIAFRGTGSVLAGLDIAVNKKFHKPVVYTYGSPRVGDPAFAAKFNKVKNSLRVFNVHDIIPYIPDKVYPPHLQRNGCTINM